MNWKIWSNLRLSVLWLRHLRCCLLSDFPTPWLVTAQRVPSFSYLHLCIYWTSPRAVGQYKLYRQIKYTILEDLHIATFPLLIYTKNEYIVRKRTSRHQFISFVLTDLHFATSLLFHVAIRVYVCVSNRTRSRQILDRRTPRNHSRHFSVWRVLKSFRWFTRLPVSLCTYIVVSNLCQLFTWFSICSYLKANLKLY